MTVIRPLICTLTVLALCAPSLAEAQGRGRPKTPRTTAAAETASTSKGRGAAAAPATAPAFRQFGAWLDDATAASRGEGRLGVGAGYWRSSGASVTDIAILDLSLGVTDRFQVSASVPFYRSSYAGVTSRGVDDVYLSGKFVAVDAGASNRGFGLALTPVLEILSAGYTDDRVHWALPVSVEMRRSPVRVYGSAGYFSRGSVFGGGAIEWATPAGTVITGSLTQSISTASEPAITNASRADASVGIAHAVADAVSTWVSIGRSLSSPDGQGTTLGIAGGLSFSFAARQPRP